MRQLPLIILLFLFFSLISASSKKHICTPKSSHCCHKNKPVCGYFSQNCPEGECPKTFPDSCSACQDDTINYYTTGSCKSDTISCAVVLLPNPCDDSINPVCGSVKGDPKTFENLCVACSEAADSLIRPGACKTDPKNFCENFNGDNCSEDSNNPVCAYFREGCSEGYCVRTFNSACAACQDDTIVYYEPGSCKQDEEVLSCAAATFPEECPDEESPVCADLTEDCPDTGCAVTFPSFCVQCQNAASSFARPGACPHNNRIFVDPNNRPEECVTDEVNPVCGWFKEGCPQGLCPRTYDNPCLARQDESVVVYEPGRCAEETISCAVVLIPEECPDEEIPVCTGDDPATYANLCEACKSDASSLIKPGACRS